MWNPIGRSCWFWKMKQITLTCLPHIPRAVTMKNLGLRDHDNITACHIFQGLTSLENHPKAILWKIATYVWVQVLAMAISSIATSHSFVLDLPLFDGPNKITSRPWNIIHLFQMSLVPHVPLKCSGKVNLDCHPFSQQITKVVFYKPGASGSSVRWS